MKRSPIFVALLLAAPAWVSGQESVAAAAVGATTQATPAETQVPIQRIVLFSSGVGFFEHGGVVNGNASAELMFKTEQINDILKSLMLADGGGGKIRSVNYPSLDPLSKTLKSFQIDISANPSMADMLNQIRGAKALVALGDEVIEGTIMGVQKMQRPVGNPEKLQEVWQLNLVTATGIRGVMLEDVKRIDIQDPTLQKELQQALQALAQVRDKDKKAVTINFDGEGERRVSIGYVVETPIWKTSYRLLLPSVGAEGPAQLQGWAIVENQTENDWSGVDLTLIGGRPLSFIENLYQPLYIPRPVTSPKTYASVRPQTYDEGMEMKARETQPGDQPQKLSSTAAAAPAAGARAGGGGGRGGAGGGRGRGAGAAPGDDGGVATLDFAFSEASPAAPPPDYSVGVASIAQADKVAELFQYQIGNVSLPRQRSAILPIVTDGVDFDRLSIYNAGVLPRNPLLGVRLKNSTGKYLLGGPLTILNTVPEKGAVYAGDARIDDAPIGAERLLSYGVDQETLIDSTKVTPSERLMTASIVKGVMTLRHQADQARDYVIQNKSDHDKTVVIEDPVNLPFELVEPAKPLEKTDALYRFQTVVAAGKTATFSVKKRWVRAESIALLPLDIGAFESYVTNGEIPEAVKTALREAVQRKNTLTDLQRAIEQKEKDRTRILDEEQNIRSNITVLPAGSQTRDEQIKNLTEHEAELAKINAELKDLQTKFEAARSDLEKYLGELNVQG